MKELVLKSLLEGVGLGVLLVLVCAFGIRRGTRRVMVPFLYLAVKSLYWSRGRTLKKILWCDDDAIKPYFIAAGKALKFGNLRRQMADSLENKPFPPLPETVQKRAYFEFGSAEEHLKYRAAVMKAYPEGNYPIFEGYNHMQYQIREPQGFAEMLRTVVKEDRLPALPFLKTECRKEVGERESHSAE